MKRTKKTTEFILEYKYSNRWLRFGHSECFPSFGSAVKNLKGCKRKVPFYRKRKIRIVKVTKIETRELQEKGRRTNE